MRTEYYAIMGTAKAMLKQADNVFSVIDFIIEALGRELVYYSSNTLLHMAGNEIPEDFSERFLYPFVDPVLYEKEVVKFDVWDNNFVCCPWRIERLCPAIRDIAKDGFLVEPYHLPEGIYYPELKLGVITNGYHHVYVARMKNQGFANVCMKPLTPYFDVVYTDGSKWFGPDRTYSADNAIMASIYTLAQWRCFIKRGKDLSVLMAE